MNTVVLNLDKNVLLKNLNSRIVGYITFPLYFILYDQSWVIMKLSFFLKLVVLQHKNYTKNFMNSYTFSDSYYTLAAAGI